MKTDRSLETLHQVYKQLKSSIQYFDAFLGAL